MVWEIYYDQTRVISSIYFVVKLFSLGRTFFPELNELWDRPARRRPGPCHG